MSADLTRRQMLTTVLIAGLPLSRRHLLFAQSKQSAITYPKLSDNAFPLNSNFPIEPKPFAEVKLRDSFWKPKMERNASVTIPFEMQKFQETGKPINNNVLQAAIYSLRTYPDARLQAQVNTRIQEIITNGQNKPARNEFFEVAAAHYEATGSKELLSVAMQSADAIYDSYKSNPRPFSGGERDAINCLQLYRATGEKRYLDLAKYYLDIRGLPNSVNRSRHNQSYKPVLEQTEAVGHAVNDASLMVSLVDVGMLTGIKDYYETAARIWNDVVSSKMYVTGGIGSTGNEGFGLPYSLPNLSAYCETCAGAMFTTFNHKMFLATGDAKFIDVMERTMYNNLIDGVSVAGDHFFYVNRLASSGDGRDTRWERASLECCPPNFVRFMASMPQYIYAQSRQGDIYINLYVSSEASFTSKGGKIVLSAVSEMPWGGRTKFTIGGGQSASATLKLRIPGWVRNEPAPGGLYSYLEQSSTQARLALNGQDIPSVPDASGYVTVSRTWNPGDILEITLPMDIHRIVADSRVREDRGRMAIQKGPIVFCCEWPDYGSTRIDGSGHILGLLMDPKGKLSDSFDENFFGGATILSGEGRSVSDPASAPKPVKLIPYHLWANRGAGEMTVWLSKEEYKIGDVGPAGGLIFFVNPNSAKDGWRYMEAASYDQSAGAKWGSFRTALPGAQGSAVGTGRQNTIDMVAASVESGSAADLCNHHNERGITGWFLPSIDELSLMYANLQANGIQDFGAREIPDNFSYWSSTQSTTDMSAHLDFADNGRRHSDDKDYPRRVRAIRYV